MPINDYLKSVQKQLAGGIATEHSYRGDLQQLLSKLVQDITVTNEPKRQRCGAPDFILQKKDVPVGYIEAKDIGIDLDKIQQSEQMKRYLDSLNNLILTDYLEFRFYKFGQLVHTTHLAVFKNDKFTMCSENFDMFHTHIMDFCSFSGQTITSADKLACMMAQKARMMEEVLFKVVSSDDDDNKTLNDQFTAFRDILIDDLKEKTFADIYAQTIAYGLFAARLNDQTLENFSRQEARDLIPRSNPFLRSLFDYICGADLDERVVWIVDDLCEIFRAVDLQSLFEDFGNTAANNDPFIHFYETFLAAYDPNLRKSRGVYYTPEPVVNFIVRAVDDVLINEFGLTKGLADTSKVKINREKTDKDGKSIHEEIEVHRVQILDPATGTGTFLAETIKQIASKFINQQGIWSSYVESDLIPRINGFELLMASYTMCHLKISMILKKYEYKPKDPDKLPRLKVFLTNSLEEIHHSKGNFFASWLIKESRDANDVKRNTPVMCVIGNPPYSGESANKGQWIMDRMEDYKKEPGGQEKLKEKNPKWINDDYVKFMRYGQYFIERNGSGILAFINPHGFLDNPTFRGMRWNLLKTYDKIYVIDLHGNAKKKEVCPDGSKDENVFDIQQGVSINIMVKTGKKAPDDLARVFHYDLYGKREDKYHFLYGKNLKKMKFTELTNIAPMYFMVKKDFDLQSEYHKGFSITDIFPVNSVGIATARDNFTIQRTKDDVKKVIDTFLSLDDEQARTHFNLGKDVREWKVEFARKDLQDNYPNKGYLRQINYRPFDTRWTFYTGKSKGFHCRPRNEIMRHLLNMENVGIGIGRQGLAVGNMEWCLATVSTHPVDFNTFRRGGVNFFPLYLSSQDMFEHRRPNLNMDIVDVIAKNLQLSFTPEKEQTEGTFAPIDILDYIYAVLHSNTYRQRYSEFLKIDFPRVPYPADAHIFEKMVAIGSQIRQVHLLQSSAVEDFKTSYPVDGSNMVTRAIGQKDWELTDDTSQTIRLWINQEQFFDGIPLNAWNFYIGGYQPAQKWLKDRKGDTLSADDISHYQKIIAALSETVRLMEEVDKIWKTANE